MEPQVWIAYFPAPDGIMGNAYGPFDSEDDARRYAATLSVDPDEGRIATVTLEEGISEREERLAAIRAAWPNPPASK